MAIKDKSELLAEAEVIRDETTKKANTAVRVGQHLYDVIDSVESRVEAKADALTSDQNYVSDAQLAVIAVTSGTNTGDQDLSGYQTSTDNSLNTTSKQVAGAINELADQADPYLEIGEIINENFNDISDWTNTGSGSFSVSSNALSISGGDTTLANYLRYDGYGNCSAQKFTAKMSITPATAGASTYGIGFMLIAYGGSSNVYRICIRAHFESGADFGKLEFITNNGSVAISTNGLTASTNLHSFIIQKSDNDISAILINEVTKKKSVLTVNLSNSHPVTTLVPPGYRFGIVSHGGSHIIDNFTVKIHDKKQVDFLAVGDSITAGFFSVAFTERWPEQISEATGKTYGINATGSLLIDGVNANEVLSYQAQTIILLIGSNNVSISDSAATIRSKLAALISSLTGYTVGTNLFICTLLPRITFVSQINAVNADIFADYTSGVIDLNSPFSGSFETALSLYSIDGIHPNFAAQKIIAVNIISALNYPLLNNRLTYLPSVKYSDNHKVMISNSKLRGYRPDSLLELISDETNHLHISALAGDGGLYILSNQPGTSAFCAGATLINGQWIAKYTTAVIFLLYNGEVRIYSNSGLTIGNSFTPTIISTISVTGTFAGGATAPAARVHVAAGTTAIPQMRLVSGVAPSSPTDGDLWFDGTGIKIRISGVTRTINVT